MALLTPGAALCPGQTLLGEWHLDEAGGSVATDSSPNGHHGALIDDAGFPSWGPGFVSFQASGDSSGRIEVAGIPTFHSVGSFTLMCRFRRSAATTDWQDLVSKWGPSDFRDDEWALEILPDGRPSFRIFGDGAFEDNYHLVGPQAIPFGEWHTLHATYESGSGAALFVDQVLAGAANGTVVGVRQTNIPLRIGNMHWWSPTGDWRPFAGDVDWCRVYAGSFPPLPPGAVAADAAARPRGDGASWPTALDSIPAALEAAAASAGDEVWTRAGTYEPDLPPDPNDARSASFRLPAGVSLLGGFAGGEVASADRDPNANPTILRQSIETSRTLITVDGGSATLDGIIIERGDIPPLSAEDFGLSQGGQLTLRKCVIRTDADGFLGLDPDPASPSALVLDDTRIEITVGPDQFCGNQGELLELRSPDVLTGTPVNPDGLPGLFDASGSGVFDPGTTVPWIVDRLEIEPGAVLNLTNRSGFDFTGSETDPPEALYVRELILGAGSTLNTGLNTLYYDTKSGPGDDESIPLFGFSLINIDMECQEEFDTRVRPADGFDPDHDPNVPQGRVVRLAADDPNNVYDVDGVMRMRTLAPGAAGGRNVVAHGAFARAAEDELIVTFEYQFTRDNGDALLLVSITDDPEIDPGAAVVAAIAPPGPTTLGGVDSGRLARFVGRFPRGSLDFRRGTYVQLELAGTDAEVVIDNFDPSVDCGADCGDLVSGGNTTVDTLDLLVSAAYLGGRVDPQDAGNPKWCLDAQLSGDAFHDLSDLLATDAARGAAGFCGTGLGLFSGPGGGAPVSFPAGTKWAVAGKPGLSGDDRLYPLDGAFTCDPNTVVSPASTPDMDLGHLGNGRLVADASGALYQVHAAQGLIRLDDGSVALEPGMAPAPDPNGVPGPNSAAVYVGKNDVPGTFIGLPISDVAFDPQEPDVVYVTPVVVEPPDIILPFDRYRASARLRLADDGSGDFTVEAILGVDPRTDDNVNTCEPGWPCNQNAAVLNVQHPRLVEVDAAGAVYVLASFGVNENTWLLQYLPDGQEGYVEQRIDLSEWITGAGALELSSADPTRVYVASSIEDGDAAAELVTLAVGANGAVSLTATRTLDAPGMTDLFPPGTDLRTVATDLVEDPNSGAVAALLLTYAPDIGRSATPTEFSAAVLALVPDPANPAGDLITGTRIGCGLGLPVSLARVTITAEPEPCVGDLDGNGGVDFDDLLILLGNFGCMSPPCAGDSDQDGDTDFDDLLNILGNFGTDCE